MAIAKKDRAKAQRYKAVIKETKKSKAPGASEREAAAREKLRALDSEHQRAQYERDAIRGAIKK